MIKENQDFVDVYISNGDGDELHYKCKTAITDEEKIKGLQNISGIDPDEGMLFIYNEPQRVSYWMKDVKIPLTIVFIGENYEVISVYDAMPMDETPMIEDNVKLVLEVSEGEDIEEGDDVFVGNLNDGLIKSSSNEDPDMMMVLNEDCKVQMKLEGGERIVSRHETEVLIRKAKMAKRFKNRNKSKYRKYCKELGRYIFSVFEKQDNREQETIDV